MSPRVVLASALLTLLVPTFSSATVMVELSLEDLVAHADAIVRATVVRTGTTIELRARSGSCQPHTVSELRVDEWLKGSGSLGSSVVVEEIGGDWQGGGMRIAGIPVYRVGEEVVVFLERHPDHPARFRTLAMAQGKFVVRRGIGSVPASVRRGVDAVAFARWSSGRMQITPGANGPIMQLDGFLDLVRAIVHAGGTR